MSEYKVKYTCTCAAMNPVIQMQYAMGILQSTAVASAVLCGKSMPPTRWVCSRPNGHVGECVACNQHGEIVSSPGHWHGATAEFPNGRWSSWEPEP